MSISSFNKCLAGSCAWKGKGKLCITVPVEMVRRYRRKVSTPAAVDRCRPFQGSGWLNVTISTQDFQNATSFSGLVNNSGSSRSESNNSSNNNKNSSKNRSSNNYLVFILVILFCKIRFVFTTVIASCNCSKDAIWSLYILCKSVPEGRFFRPASCLYS